MQLKVQKRDTITRDIDNRLRELQRVPREAFEVFRAATPKQTGNARRNTRLQGNDIVANYPYAVPLDEGRSKQSPEGMSKPTGEFIQQRVDNIMKG